MLKKPERPSGFFFIDKSKHTMHTLFLPVPENFHFEHTVFSHGWCSLAPFSLSKEHGALASTLRIGNAAVPLFFQFSKKRSAIQITHQKKKNISARTAKSIIAATGDIFSLDLQLEEFYRLVSTEDDFAWIAKHRTGRMLRAQSFFEDVVKMILTTNCSWSFTTIMVENLVIHCSSTSQPSFPSPEDIAECSEKFLREKVKLGYRVPFIREFAQNVVKGALRLDHFRTSSAATIELYKELRCIKGIGDYAASNLLRLLGRFNYLGLDSWCRNAFARLHHGEKPASDKQIEKFYARFGEWKGLVMWIDLTKNWYFDKFPLA